MRPHSGRTSCVDLLVTGPGKLGFNAGFRPGAAKHPIILANAFSGAATTQAATVPDTQPPHRKESRWRNTFFR